MKELLKNKPWKQWKTRKFSFLYMIFLCTLAIGLTGIFTNFSIEWLEEVRKFCQFVVGTGTALIIAPSFTELKKTLNGGYEDD